MRVNPKSLNNKALNVYFGHGKVVIRNRTRTPQT